MLIVSFIQNFYFLFINKILYVLGYSISSYGGVNSCPSMHHGTQDVEFIISY
jgi:hypothetical protein